MKVIAFIPVRGGSKSIPNKNIKDFCGRPLVYWNLKALEEADSVDEIVVATDSLDIEIVVNDFNFKKVKIYRRSQHNASDTSTTESVMLEYINLSTETLSNEDIFMLVQATSPLTESHHFVAALKEYQEGLYDSMLTCVRFKRFLWTEEGQPKNYNFLERPRRQEFNGELLENGAFYINTVGNVKSYNNRLSGKIGVYVMPEHTAVEIDEEDDWLIAEKLMRKHVFDITSKRSNKGLVKMFISDVDGVLTDAGMYYSESGDELKKFNTHDGMAFQMLRELKVKTAIITTENTQIVTRRAEKLKVDYLVQGKREGGKLEAALEICEKEGLTLDEVAYIGDDINCLNLITKAGYSACPANAVKKIKEVPGIVHLATKGGDGAVREYVEYLISHNFLSK